MTPHTAATAFGDTEAGAGGGRSPPTERSSSAAIRIPAFGAVFLRGEGDISQDPGSETKQGKGVGKDMKKECIAMLLAGGQGSRLYVLTGEHGQARRALRREVPHHRLSPVQLHQLRHRHRGRADPVPARWSSTATSAAACPGTWTAPPAASTSCRPTMGSKGGTWYKGTANAIYQNIGFIDLYDPDYVVILSGDHIYKMDYSDMVARHKVVRAACTISVMEVPWDGGVPLRHHERRRATTSSRSLRKSPRSPRATWPPWASTSSPGRPCARYLERGRGRPQFRTMTSARISSPPC